MSNKISMPTRLISFFSALVIMLALATCVQSNAAVADTGFTVKGYIKSGFTYSSSSAPGILSNFNVAVDGTQISSVTDSNGYFELRNVPGSISGYPVRISKSGYLTRTIPNLSISSNVILSTQSSPIDIWAGDMNGDLAVNMTDIMEVAKAFNTISSDLRYIPVLDINKDNAIDMSDIMLVARYFNKSAADYPQDITPISVTQSPTPAPTATSSPTLKPTNTPTSTPTKIPSPSPTAGLTGNITYTLVKASSPTADQLSAYTAITAAMDQAISYYNQYTNIVKHLTVYYEPTVATADANINGTIRFGKKEYMNHITAMHEIAHTSGIGTSTKYTALIKDGIFTGVNATNQLRAITGNPQDVVHGDRQHFWPYGLNYTSEVRSTQDLVNHCKMVVAIRKDMG